MTARCPHCDSPLPDPARCESCHRYFAEGLLKHLEHPNPSVRRSAADNLVFVDFTPKTVAALADALNDPDSDVRTSAGVTLFIAKTGVRTIVPQLIHALEHSDLRVRRLAAACLSNLGSDAAAALPRLRQFGEATDRLLRLWVAEAVQNIESR